MTEQEQAERDERRRKGLLLVLLLILLAVLLASIILQSGRFSRNAGAEGVGSPAQPVPTTTTPNDGSTGTNNPPQTPGTKPTDAGTGAGGPAAPATDADGSTGGGTKVVPGANPGPGAKPDPAPEPDPAPNPDPAPTPPPTPTITAGPDDPTNATGATLYFTSSGATSYLCSTDVAPTFVECANPKIYPGGTFAEGAHTFQVKAVSAGGTSNAATYTWTVDLTPPPAPPTSGPAPDNLYTISGSVSAALHPGGLAAPINVTFSSTNAGNGGSGVDGTRVSGLAVSITSVTGPNINGAHPCTAADFALTQFSGAYPFYVPQGASSLFSLGFASGTWPTLRLKETGLNQDGCKGASIHLSYAGTP